MATNSTMSQADRSAQAFTILQRSVCLTLRCSFLGNHRVVDTEDVAEAFKPGVADNSADATGVDKRAFHTAKKLIDDKEIAPVRRRQNLAKAYLRSVAIQSNRVFGDRTYLVPMGLVSQVDETLTRLRDEMLAEAAALALRYEGAVARQRLSLGPLFRVGDYKTPTEVAEAFSLEWDFVQFAAPERLETVSHALFAQSQARHESRMAQAYDEVKLVLREALREIVAGVARSLEPGKDGKRKAFHSTVLDDLANYLETFPLRDIADDAELGVVVDRLRRLTAGLDVETLKDSDKVRKQVLRQAESVVETLDGLVAPFRRAIRLPGQAA